MKTTLTFVVIVLIAFLSTAPGQHRSMSAGEPGGAKTATAPGGTSLSDLPVAARAQISAVLGRDDRRYHAAAHEGGVRLANRRHQFAADFDAAGVAVRAGAATWGLGLHSFGYGNDLQTVGAVTPFALANRVEYRRGSLNEWYVNGPSGLEQGFTIERAPGDRTGEPLTLAFQTSGDLTTAVDASGKTAVLSRADGTPALRYRGLTAYDATGRELRAWLSVGDRRLLLHVDDTGAQYPLIVDPFIEQAALIASDGAAGDQFGAVAVAGDTIVVGAWLDDVGANADQGSAYVFVKPAAGWSGLLSEQARLIAADGAAGDAFGLQVAVDGETVVVGARFDDISTRTNQGSAYVFVKPASGWSGTLTESAKLTALGGNTNDWFGDKVAVDGDTIVVGARLDDIPVPGGSFPVFDRGSAFVFVRPAAGWNGTLTQNATLNPSSLLFFDSYQFGSAVAIDGDIVVVGAFDPRNCLGCGGDAFVFVKPATGWSGSRTEDARLRASDPAFADHFGISIAISGDTIVVGSHQDDTGTRANHGSAYVFVKPAEGWSGTLTQNAKLTASDGAAGDEFGFPVAMSGNTIVVAARLDDVGANVDQGSVYVFTEPAGGWSGALNELEKLTASDGARTDAFGNFLAFSAAAVIVGAPFYDSGTNADQGSVYVYAADHADLSLTKAGSPNSVSVGDNVTYTLTLSNKGPSEARSITVTDDLPAEVSFVSCETTGGGSCSGSGNNRTVALASLEAGGSQTITIVARVDSATPSGTVTNTASVMSGSDPVAANDSSTATIRVENMDATPPTIESLVTPGANAAGWHNSPPTITWSLSDPESGLAASTGCDTTTVAVDTSDLVLTCSATNGAGLSASASVAIRRDTVAPTITGSRSSAANASGWNNTDITVSFDCGDDRAGVSNCTPPQTLTAEGSGHAVTGTVQDAAGNTASLTVGGINIDKTPPVVSGIPSRGPDANGWYNHAFDVIWSGTDALSGSGICNAPTPYVGPDTVAGLVGGECTDAAGNVGGATSAFRFDATPPSIAIAHPADGAALLFRQAVTASYSCGDATSGVAGCAGPVASGAALDTNAAGIRTFTVNAMDLAGNTAALISQYRVAYGFEGFFEPLNNLPTTNRGPAGRTFPVKFALRDAGGNAIGDPAAVMTVGIESAVCGPVAADVDGEQTAVDTGGLKYDPLTGVWQFNWQTMKSHSGCWLLNVRLADGSVHRVAFELR